MYKEIGISIIIVIAVVVANVVGQNYMKQSVKTLEGSLNEIKQEMQKEDNEPNIIKGKMADLRQDWKVINERLAYYIEHDELEKVETELYTLNANIDTNEYEQGIEKIEKCKFILRHIQNKEAFNLRNIF